MSTRHILACLLLCACAGPATATAAKAAPAATASAQAESVTVTVRGRLQAGVMAIGGETTGITVSARGMTMELDLGQRPKLAALAQHLDGKLVEVSGTLEMQDGVERQGRMVIRVTSLRAG